MNKNLLAIALTLPAFALFAVQTEATNAVVNAQIRDNGTDEIDLEEMDDSAEAAKKAQIKPTEKDTGFIDISCDEATLADILRQFRKTTRANLIYNESTNLLRRVSTDLRHVRWDTALQSILSMRGFRLEVRDGIYFVTEDKTAEPVLTKTFTLNHAEAGEMANLFNASYAAKDAGGKTLCKIATAFPEANVVVVTATEKTLADCEAIIKAVDKAVAQIYIEARFLELSSGALHKLGVDWSSLESWSASATGLKAGWQSSRGTAANYGSKLSNRNVTGSKTQTEIAADGKQTQSITGEQRNDTYTGLVPEGINEAAGAGLSASDMAWENARGFSGQLSAQDFSLAMSAFESLGEGKIFSNPKVIVSNGKEAKVDMTTKFPNVDVTSQRDTSTTSPYTDISTKIQVIPGDKDKGMFAGDIFFSWGITLSVKPRISPDGLISVEIAPTISQCDSFYEVGKGEDSNKGAYSKFPIIDMKRINTDFTMRDGATAVIGGLSKTTEEDVDTGIPYLRKIPWIGPKLFGWKSRQKVQKEIIVCVTIGIANPADLPMGIGLPKNAILGREYVEGRRLEPGDRQGTADGVLALDLDAIEVQQRRRNKDAGKSAQDKEPAPGTVTITPSDE